MPLSREELQALSEMDVREPIPADLLKQALASPPFLASKVLVNARDLGATPGSPIKPNWIYRSGTLEKLSTHREAMPALKRIFDLRTDTEHGHFGKDPQLDGVENVWFPPAGDDTQIDVGDFVEGGGEMGVEKGYLSYLSLYVRTFRAVLEHVRDRPGEAFLFHCTAGRDRTGVLAGMLQALAGMSAEDVRLEYMLSRIGTEVAREHLIQFARMGTGVTSDDTPGFLNLCSLRRSCWDAFTSAVERDYGGWDGYVTKELGFSSEDLAKIKKNLRE